MVKELDLGALNLWRLKHLDKTSIYRPQTDQELEIREARQNRADARVALLLDNWIDGTLTGFEWANVQLKCAVTSLCTARHETPSWRITPR